jgi:hypothetical protein
MSKVLLLFPRELSFSLPPTGVEKTFPSTEQDVDGINKLIDTLNNNNDVYY